MSDRDVSRKAGRWRRWVLPASLVVNLLLLGILAGGLLAGHDRPPGRDGGRIGFNPLEQAVPEPARAKVSAVFERDREARRQTFRELREARAAVREAMQRTPYDSAAAAAALDQLRDRSVAVQNAFHQLMLAVTEALTPEERAAFVEALDRPRRGDGHRPPPPGEGPEPEGPPAR